jgi:hypothetical protein
MYTAFSEPIFVLANDIQIELINNATAASELSVSGPDVFDPVTGTYHVMGKLFKTSGEYTVRAEILAIGSEQTNERMVYEFRMQVTTAAQTPLY